MPVAAVMGIGSVVGSIVGGVSASKAANAQAQAAMHAADLQHQDAQQALAFQKQMFGTQQENIAPWLKAGGAAETQLSSLMGPGGALSQGWDKQFQAPTNVTEQNDPGYQFRLQQGTEALNNSAAARGGLLSGGTAKALQDYTQNYASNEYSNVYGRAFNEYATQYNQFQTNQSNQFNRLSALAGGGQVAAAQINQAGSQAAGNVSNILLTSGQQIGQNINNAGAARASGYVGIGNAITGGINNLSQLAYMQNQGYLG